MIFFSPSLKITQLISNFLLRRKKIEPILSNQTALSLPLLMRRQIMSALQKDTSPSLDPNKKRQSVCVNRQLKKMP